ncbi:MAG: AAA family ATPase [Phototrophicaceae bacterium]
MKVISLMNEKGGVGKTTLASTIGAGLAIMGYRVLMIDADPQGHLGISYGLEKSPALYDLLVRDAEFSDRGIVKIIDPDEYALPNAKAPEAGKLFVVCGNKETRLIAQAMEGEPFGIRSRMMELAEDNIVDYVIFDTSPTPSTLHAMIYLATDHIIYPTEVTYLSFDGLVASIKNTTGYDKVKQGRGLGVIKKTGIIPTKFRGKTLEHREKLKSLRQGFGDMVWNPLPMSVVWEEANARKRSIFRYAYDHPAAADAWKVVRTVKERVSDGTS